MGDPSVVAGSVGTEPGTGNRTVLEPELAEPAIKTEPDEPEPIFGSMGTRRFNFGTPWGPLGPGSFQRPQAGRAGRARSAGQLGRPAGRPAAGAWRNWRRSPAARLAPAWDGVGTLRAMREAFEVSPYGVLYWEEVRFHGVLRMSVPWRC